MIKDRDLVRKEGEEGVLKDRCRRRKRGTSGGLYYVKK